MNTIAILSGTDRPGSQALKVANHIKPLYEAHGVEARVISLEEFPLGEVAGGKYGQSLPEVEAFRNRVLEADGIVMVIPEYNGSFPGILKVFIDYLPFPEAFDKKPIAFVGEAAGAFGALRAVEQLQMVCSYRNAHNYPERVFIQRVRNNFSEDEGIKDKMVAELLESQVKGFIRFVASLAYNQPHAS
ncbi:NAD(P)H-dependent oxidoreductase [Balneolales bacterium ANBcel1]|nr:NAD(P)H-dependent oxidoreductase [Balneolales bacterium ANBcel1]